MTAHPLSSAQVDALLRSDPRTAAADMFVLRDTLLRLGDAWVELADAATHLRAAADDLAQARRLPPLPPIAPRAD